VNFETLNYETIREVLRMVPETVQRQMERRLPIVVAGGVIRDTVAGLPVKDVDVFCHSQEQAEMLALEASPFVRKSLFAYSVQSQTPRPAGFDRSRDITVQYIFYKDFKHAKDLVSQFDFRACCAGVYYYHVDDEHYGWCGVAAEGFHKDCRDRVLHFMSQAKDAGKLTALRRALDFAGKGWTISNDEVAAILEHWQGLEHESRPEDCKHPSFYHKAAKLPFSCGESPRVRVVRAFRPAYGGRR
jgi:hypothetical protein